MFCRIFPIAASYIFISCRVLEIYFCQTSTHCTLATRNAKCLIRTPHVHLGIAAGIKQIDWLIRDDLTNKFKTIAALLRRPTGNKFGAVSGHFPKLCANELSPISPAIKTIKEYSLSKPGFCINAYSIFVSL